MKKVTIPEDFFEHLLACLANQKFIHVVNADGMEDGEDEVRKTQTKIQKAIDDAYSKGWEFLNIHGMRTLKWNGEYWYVDKRNLWKRCRQWLIWIGGWEKPNGTGWKFYNSYSAEKRLMPPFPVSIFGHRVTFFGSWFQIKLKPLRFILTISKRSGVYVSNNGTPPNERNKGFYIYRKKQESALLKRLRREAKS